MVRMESCALVQKWKNNDQGVLRVMPVAEIEIINKLEGIKSQLLELKKGL